VLLLLDEELCQLFIFYTFIFPSFFFLLELTAFSADNGNQQ